MRSRSILLIATLGCASGLIAQKANPLSSDLRQNYKEQKGILLAEAERMPDAGYAFKATPDVGTFGSRVAHVAEAQFMICSAVKGESKKADLAGKTSKPDILAALKASFDYCDGVYGSFTDAHATDPVTIFGERQTKLSALWGNLAHDEEMYGYMAVYLRLKGLVPPTSDPRPK
jgi:DinB superfamily